MCGVALYDNFSLHNKDDYVNGNLIRFADDMVITVRTHRHGMEVLTLLRQFLEQRGLRQNENKIYLSKVLLGFEFLSRWYQRNEDILIVRPADKAVKGFEDGLEHFILDYKGSQKALIEPQAHGLGQLSPGFQRL